MRCFYARPTFDDVIILVTNPGWKVTYVWRWPICPNKEDKRRKLARSERRLRWEFGHRSSDLSEVSFWPGINKWADLKINPTLVLNHTKKTQFPVYRWKYVFQSSSFFKLGKKIMGLLFTLCSQNSVSIWLPVSGKTLFQFSIWKHHLQCCLLFGVIGHLFFYFLWLFMCVCLFSLYRWQRQKLLTGLWLNLKIKTKLIC